MCCVPLQPTPPGYQSRGYGSATIAAIGLQRTYCCCCILGIAATLGVQLHCNQPPARYQVRGHGGAALPHSSCSARTAAVAACVLFRACMGTAAKPAPSPIEGPRGCCHCRTLAAAHVLQLPLPVSCRTIGTAAAPHPTAALLLTELLMGGEGLSGGGCTGAGGAGGGHLSARRRVLFSTPVHYSTRWRE